MEIRELSPSRIVCFVLGGFREGKARRRVFAKLTGAEEGGRSLFTKPINRGPVRWRPPVALAPVRLRAGPHLPCVPI